MPNVTLFILLSVYEPNHGYGIMRFIENETNNRLSLGAGTLYGAINTLVKKGWIQPFGDLSNSRKKQYIITDDGKQIVDNEIIRLKDVLNISFKITGR